MKIANMNTMTTATMAIMTIGHTYTGIEAATAASVLRLVVVPEVVSSSSVVVVPRLVGEGSTRVVKGC